MSLTEVQKAYIAGIIDGEGNISALIHRKGLGRQRRIIYQVRISISNTNLAVLQTIQGWCGAGRIGEEFRGKFHIYRLVFSTLQGEELLHQILPYLIIKRAKAELYIQLRTSRRSHYNRDCLKDETTGRFAISPGGTRYTAEEEALLGRLRDGR